MECSVVCHEVDGVLVVVVVTVLLLLLSDTPNSFGAFAAAADLEDSISELAISRSFPSRNDSVEAFGVAESDRRCESSWFIHDADSMDGGRNC